MNINVTGGHMEDAELNHYRERAIVKYSDKIIKSMDIKVDGEFVDISYRFEPKRFERIRRITGYLSNLENFNSAKQREEADRIKHV